MLIDSHCHLTDEKYDDDRWEVLARARASDVERIITICSNAADIPRVEKLLSEASVRVDIPGIWGTAGVHPHDAEGAEPSDLEKIQGALTANQRMVAVGETGLDFFYDNSPRAVQESLFRAHLELGSQLGLPVVVHSREADELTAKILEEWGGRVQGVLHCYTGGEDLLHAALRVGWMVSFTGMITFKKYDAQELVRSVPTDRLMVETDGPYLAPTPFRGRRNEPAHVTTIADVLAEIRGETREEVVRYTGENANRFFGLEA